MEVARSPVAPVAIPSASQVAPPGARDAADGFSQISTRDLKPSAATPPERRAPRASGKWLSQLVKSSVFAQNSLSLRTGEAKRPPTRTVVASALARDSQLALFASRGRVMSVHLYEEYTNLHTIPITRSKTPPRAPASTYPETKRPARPGARTPTALRRTCPTRPRGSPLPRVHGPPLLMKQTRPNLQQSPIPVTRGRRRPRSRTHTK